MNYKINPLKKQYCHPEVSKGNRLRYLSLTKTLGVFFICALFYFNSTCIAQDSTQTVTIITDRPDASNTPFLVHLNYLQIEIGAQIDGDKVLNNTNTNYQTLFTLNNTSIKYSPLSLLELKLITGYGVIALSKQSYLKENVFNERGISPIVLGSKIFLFKQKGILPHTTFESNFTLPISNTLGSPTFVAPELRLLMFNHLSKHFSLSTNIGLDYLNSAKIEKPRYLYTLSLGIALTERMGAFIENYGYFQKNNSADYRIDGGLTYHLKNDLQIDVAGGYGLSKVSTDFFVTTGISWRFKVGN